MIVQGLPCDVLTSFASNGVTRVEGLARGRGFRVKSIITPSGLSASQYLLGRRPSGVSITARHFPSGHTRHAHRNYGLVDDAVVHVAIELLVPALSSREVCASNGPVPYGAPLFG